MTRLHTPRTTRLIAVGCGLLLALSACGSSTDLEASDVSETTATTAMTDADMADMDMSETTETSDTTEASDDAAATSTTSTDAVVASGDCVETAALFVTRGSANPDLDDPEVEAACDGVNIVITSNAIPDYTYIGTSPGVPTDRDISITIPATPTLADAPTDVPLLGTAAISLGGIPIFGPTEGTGGDVDSLPGILSECGSHNGPSGFHIHKIMTSANTDCLFTPEEVAASPQLVGYALDGFPIYTGTGQYTSSWELTDETLFATDTWAAHTYVEGSGDLDQCNGLTDADGNYAYYTTDTFPYVVGCYMGVVEIEAPEGGARPERPEPGDAPAGDATGDPAAGPEAADDANRPERPAPGDDGARPERPAPGEDGDRPAPPDAPAEEVQP